MKNKSLTGKAVCLAAASQKKWTKFGGKPHLPESIAWPTAPNGCELDFLAQIHFPENPSASGLPETGTLFVFYDDPENWKIIYSEESLPEFPREPAQGGHAPRLYRESFRTFKLSRTGRCHSAPHHQMLGTPYILQHDNRTPGYQLLLQLDSDWGADSPGWMWGDAGMLYFFIRQKDLTAKKFDGIKVIWECC